MYCLQCKTQIPDDSDFCHNCGANVESQRKPVPAASNEPRAVASRATRAVREAAPGERPRSKYVGASLVSGTLLLLGWLIAVAGVILGLGLTSLQDLGDEEVGDAERVGMFLGAVIVCWLVAVGVLWSAYVLRLLSDIERRLGGR